MCQKIVYFSAFFILYVAKIYCGPIAEPIKTHGHSQKSVPNCDDTINGIGIDWDGSDTTIDPKHYECINGQQKHFNDLTVKEMCKTPPLVILILI